MKIKHKKIQLKRDDFEVFCRSCLRYFVQMVIVEVETNKQDVKLKNSFQELNEHAEYAPVFFGLFYKKIKMKDSILDLHTDISLECFIKYMDQNWHNKTMWETAYLKYKKSLE